MTTPTLRTDAAERARQEYVEKVPDGLWNELKDGGYSITKDWLKNAPPDGWEFARQLERELNQWKEDAERLATELHCYTQWVTKRSIHEALSLHEQLMKGTKK